MVAEKCRHDRQLVHCAECAPEAERRLAMSRECATGGETGAFSVTCRDPWHEQNEFQRNRCPSCKVPASLLEAAKQVRAAVRNEGRAPHYHKQVMLKVGQEWPTLMNAVDNLIATLERNEK